jgi:hypothetical protein
MKKYCYFLVFLVIISTFSITTVLATDKTVLYPIAEYVDLYIDGSTTAQTVNLTEDFDYVARITFTLIFDGDIDFLHFGALGTPLTNGTAIQYNSSSLFSKNITCNHCFASLTYDMAIFSDDKNPIEHHLVARITFAHIVDDKGLDVRNYDLQFIVQDDITSACDNFFVCVQGYKLVSTPDNEAPPPNLLNNIQYFAVEFMSQPLLWVVLLMPLAAFWVIRK